jgi:IS4 transposase
MPVRVVGEWNTAAHRYHLYLTNVPREKLGLEHIPAVYAARWEIELLSASSRPNTESTISAVAAGTVPSASCTHRC